ncbi:MAG TPA: sigma-70 family RNA polymerase sigma factor [Planctomycetota bacterium]
MPKVPRNTKTTSEDKPKAASPAVREEDLGQWRQLVWYVVNRIRTRLPSCVAEEDLFSAGMVGLMTAARSYDPARGAEFKTYAYHRIRGAILDELRRMDFLPRSQREKARANGEEAPSVVGIPTDEDGQVSLVASDHGPSFEDEDLAARLDSEIDRLPAKMRTVMSLYYRSNLRMREIGDQLALTESRVSQIHSNSVARLRRSLRIASGE